MIFEYVETGEAVQIKPLDYAFDNRTGYHERDYIPAEVDAYDNLYYERRPRKKLRYALVNRILTEFGHCLAGATCPVPAFYAEMTDKLWTRITFQGAPLPRGAVFSPYNSEPLLDWGSFSLVVRSRRPRKVHRKKSTGQYVQSLGGRLK